MKASFKSVSVFTTLSECFRLNCRAVHFFLSASPHSAGCTFSAACNPPSTASLGPCWWLSPCGQRCGVARGAAPMEAFESRSMVCLRLTKLILASDLVPLQILGGMLSCTVSIPSLPLSNPPLQNTNGVEAVHIAPTEFVRRQIAAVLGDIGADVVKTGMLPTPEVGEAW